jgi:glucosylceramidase
MISIDSSTGGVRYNPEFSVVKRFSHFIEPGARMLRITGNRRAELAFRNPDGRLVLVVHNDGEGTTPLRVKVGTRVLELELAGHAFGTAVVEPT